MKWVSGILQTCSEVPTCVCVSCSRHRPHRTSSSYTTGSCYGRRNASGFLIAVFLWCQVTDEGLSERDFLLDVDDSQGEPPLSLQLPYVDPTLSLTTVNIPSSYLLQTERNIALNQRPVFLKNSLTLGIEVLGPE